MFSNLLFLLCLFDGTSVGTFTGSFAPTGSSVEPAEVPTRIHFFSFSLRSFRPLAVCHRNSRPPTGSSGQESRMPITGRSRSPLKGAPLPLRGIQLFFLVLGFLSLLHCQP